MRFSPRTFLTTRTFLTNRLRAAVVTGIVVLNLAACGSSDLASIESDTFFEQAMPTWLIPKLRDDYMGKHYLQPRQAARPVARDEQGDVIEDQPLWRWPRGWPWPLPYPSPGQ